MVYGISPSSQPLVAKGSYGIYTTLPSTVETGDKNNLWCVARNTARGKLQSYFAAKPAWASSPQVTKNLTITTKSSLKIHKFSNIYLQHRAPVSIHPSIHVNWCLKKRNIYNFLSKKYYPLECLTFRAILIAVKKFMKKFIIILFYHKNDKKSLENLLAITMLFQRPRHAVLPPSVTWK